MIRLADSEVFLSGVRLYAYHGVLPQEGRVGGWYTLSVRVHYNIKKACETDCVDDTLDYSRLLQLVQTEMREPSRLLEHVAGRIAQRIFTLYPASMAVDVTIVKENPPMGAQM